MKIPNELYHMIYALVGSQELVDKWWTGANLAFDNYTPEQMYQINKSKVVSYLEWHCFG